MTPTGGHHVVTDKRAAIFSIALLVETFDEIVDSDRRAVA